MAIIKKNELKQLNDIQLGERLKELRKELMRYNAQISTKTPSENPGKIRVVKKTIAKILTRVNELKRQGGVKKQA